MQLRPIFIGIPKAPLNTLASDIYFLIKDYLSGLLNRYLPNPKSTHMGTFSPIAFGYNLKLGYHPNGYPYPFSPQFFSPMQKHRFSSFSDVFHPSPVLRGGGFAGRAGFLNSRAAVSLVSF